jgi:hypothetical protein
MMAKQKLDNIREWAEHHGPVPDYLVKELLDHEAELAECIVKQAVEMEKLRGCVKSIKEVRGGRPLSLPPEPCPKCNPTGHIPKYELGLGCKECTEGWVYPKVTPSPPAMPAPVCDVLEESS